MAPFGADMDAWAGDFNHESLALVERTHRRGVGLLSWAEVKLLSIAGVGFFMDAYDLFIINMVYSIILDAYYPKGTSAIGWGLSGGVLKASANIGNVIGQILFGLLGDALGRQAVYGKELIIVIVATIMIISAPDYLGGEGITIWMFCFRVIMGIGIGGDYPMSAAVVSDRAHLNRRGSLLATIFSAQGWGNLVGALLAVIVVAGYKDYVNAGMVHKLSGAWRILQGLALIPAFLTLYFRLTMAESTRFKQARAIQDDPDLLKNKASEALQVDQAPKEGSDIEDKAAAEQPAGVIGNEVDRGVALGLKPEGKSAHFGEFIRYMSKPRHALTLLGTALSWFFLDMAFYGINLNQSLILSGIGFTTGDTWSKLMKTATGNLIITAAGFLPGYYVTVLTVEWLGRKPIQWIGFTMTALFLGIAAGHFNYLKNHAAPFFVVFALLQFFFNFGANSTTFIIPAEVFPTRVRATAHGISAASGKVGAIITSLAFSQLATPKSIGTANVLWILFATSVAGIFTTFLIPETKGRDADVVDREELLADAQAKGLQV